MTQANEAQSMTPFLKELAEGDKARLDQLMPLFYTEFRQGWQQSTSLEGCAHFLSRCLNNNAKTSGGLRRTNKDCNLEQGIHYWQLWAIANLAALNGQN